MEWEKTVTSKGKGDAEDTVLRQIFKFAVSHDYLDGSRMPIIGQKTTRGDNGAVNRRPAFTKEQAKAILDYCNTVPDVRSEKLTNERQVFNAFIHLVLGTGIRPGWRRGAQARQGWACDLWPKWVRPRYFPVVVKFKARKNSKSFIHGTPTELQTSGTLRLARFLLGFDISLVTITLSADAKP